jgi:hypothetical protein
MNRGGNLGKCPNKAERITLAYHCSTFSLLPLSNFPGHLICNVVTVCWFQNVFKVDSKDRSITVELQGREFQGQKAQNPHFTYFSGGFM